MIRPKRKGEKPPLCEAKQGLGIRDWGLGVHARENFEMTPPHEK
jgi:hypothetical protein